MGILLRFLVSFKLVGMYFYGFGLYVESINTIEEVPLRCRTVQVNHGAARKYHVCMICSEQAARLSENSVLIEWYNWSHHGASQRTLMWQTLKDSAKAAEKCRSNNHIILSVHWKISLVYSKDVASVLGNLVYFFEKTQLELLNIHPV